MNERTVEALERTGLYSRELESERKVRENDKLGDFGEKGLVRLLLEMQADQGLAIRAQITEATTAICEALDELHVSGMRFDILPPRG